MEDRYIKCTPGVIGSPVWHDDGVLKLYLYCCCKASHNETIWRGIALHSGELPLSERNAADELEWSRSKFLRKLEQLKGTGLISVQASEAGTMIRFNHWQEACGLKTIPGGIETRPCGTETRPPEDKRYQNETASGPEMIPGGLKTRPNQYISNNNKLNTHTQQEEPEGFSKLWLAYPASRRTCKAEAIVLFQKAVSDGATIEAMISALDADKNSYSWLKEDGRYIPGIVKWLQKETWRDYLVTMPAKESKKWISR